MKKSTYILFTAGRGPIECGLAVQGIQASFKKYLECENLKYKVVNQKKGSMKRSIETIVFEIDSIDHQLFNCWIGTLQWICKSPIRKYHKRKNWFIKCEQITLGNKTNIDLNDIKIQTYRASGPGGQHRNKVETAVRIIHSQTGVMVTASDGKSQLQNKNKALQKLNKKLMEYNRKIVQDFDNTQWVNQLEIERGDPVKTFVGLHFDECIN